MMHTSATLFRQKRSFVRVTVSNLDFFIAFGTSTWDETERESRKSDKSVLASIVMSNFVSSFFTVLCVFGRNIDMDLQVEKFFSFFWSESIHQIFVILSFHNRIINAKTRIWINVAKIEWKRTCTLESIEILHSWYLYFVCDFSSNFAGEIINLGPRIVGGYL